MSKNEICTSEQRYVTDWDLDRDRISLNIHCLKAVGKTF